MAWCRIVSGSPWKLNCRHNRTIASQLTFGTVDRTLLEVILPPYLSFLPFAVSKRTEGTRVRKSKFISSGKNRHKPLLLKTHASLTLHAGSIHAYAVSSAEPLVLFITRNKRYRCNRSQRRTRLQRLDCNIHHIIQSSRIT